MKVVHVLYFYDEKFADEEELLETYYTITGWAEALQRNGAEVTVIYRFHREKSFQKDGVQYHFVKDGLGTVLKMRHLPLKFLKKISNLDADVIHLHHLSLALQTFMLRRMLKRETAIIIQHHGGILPGKNRRRVYNLLNSVADGFFFTSIEQGEEWFMRKKPAKVMQVIEGSASFNYTDTNSAKTLIYSDRTGARKKTGMTGSPVFLWVGRFDDNKDPLAVLRGVERLFAKYTNASLYMIYNDDKLSGKVKERVNNSEILKTRVHLIGKVDHDKIESFYNSADYFVSGSHAEGSGYSLIEALNSGCVPIVTDISSFRVMTDNGRLGALWKPGNEDSFVEAAIAAMNKPLDTEGKACIEFFKETLSFDAIARVAMKHYQQVLNNRRKG